MHDLFTPEKSLLPQHKTDIGKLIRDGYTVTYEKGDDDYIEDRIAFHECIRETITKNGVRTSPDDEATVRYYDNETGTLVGAAWYDNDVLDRYGAPAFVCERTEETGAACLGYRMHVYYKQAQRHNTCDRAFL